MWIPCAYPNQRVHTRDHNNTTKALGTQNQEKKEELSRKTFPPRNTGPCSSVRAFCGTSPSAAAEEGAMMSGARGGVAGASGKAGIMSITRRQWAGRLRPIKVSWSRCRSASLEVGLAGLPLDTTEEKLWMYLKEVAGSEGAQGNKITSVAVERNALGLCESGAAVIGLSGAKATGVDDVEEAALWLAERLAAASEPGSFFEGVTCAAPRDEPERPLASDLLNRLRLEQHRRDLAQLEEDFGHFENNSY